MLQNDFFRIKTIDRQEGSCKIVLELNVRHKIFGGHFPGQPVVPGACMVQMVKELMEWILRQPDLQQKERGGRLRLIRADQIKFLKVIDPSKDSIAEMSLTYSVEKGYFSKEGLGETGIGIRVSAGLANGEGTCFKFEGVFRV
ncbi:MAG: hypothetical protein P4L51_29370 [Puia sp.]|nr:hypothetical protein [Puia sp.]